MTVKSAPEMQNEPPVYILLINWNGAEDTLECLTSLKGLRYSRHSIVVVDNGSEDDSLERIRNWMRVEGGGGFNEIGAEDFFPGDDNRGVSPLLLIRSSVNRGFAGGSNLAIQHILKKGGTGYFWLLNNDTVVEPDTLRELVLAFQRDPSVGIVGSSLYWHQNPSRLQMAGGKRYVPILGVLGVRSKFGGDVLSRFYVSGASLLIGLSTVREIGVMDERFFFYGEDADWSLRANHNGLKVLHCPRSRVWHKGGHSIGSETPLQDYYLTKATLLFYAKNYPLLFPLAMVSGGLLRLLLKAGRYQLSFQTVRMVARAYLDFFSSRSRGAQWR